MVFTPDTDTNSLAYLFARGLVKGEDLAAWDLAMAEFFVQQCASGTALVTNSGTTAAPNGTIATAIAQANLTFKSGQPSFSFNPASLDWLAYLYARGAINTPGTATPNYTFSDAYLAQYDLAFLQWFMLQCTNAVTLTAAGGTIIAPTNSIASAIAAATLVAKSGNRNF